MSGGPGAGLIAIENLSHTYLRRGSAIEVLSGVEFHVDAGAYVSLVGPSGSGKSTFLAIIGGLERPQSGVMAVGGMNLSC
ncbi:MAG TPA: ATP-binding cassette domain-containing protein [Acidimicrobiales bacterium]|jgi:putative ABC transport system ATP-binding protein|nr:ATP-binding cassette domain-containing protein [Acidimicrobiales bacterium]